MLPGIRSGALTEKKHCARLIWKVRSTTDEFETLLVIPASLPIVVCMLAVLASCTDSDERTQADVRSANTEVAAAAWPRSNLSLLRCSVTINDEIAHPQTCANERHRDAAGRSCAGGWAALAALTVSTRAL